MGGTLVYAPNWLGDAVMAMPAVQRWRAGHPGARLTVLTKKGNAGLWRMHPAVDDVLVLEPGTRGTFHTAAEVRRRGFDEAILLPNSFRSALIAWWAGVRRRRGVATHGRSLLLTDRVALSEVPGDRHQSRETAPILVPAWRRDGTDTLPPPEIAVPDDVRRDVSGRFGLDGAEWRLGVIPGAARGASKRWPHFAEAAAMFARRKGGNGIVLAMGTPGEAALCDEVVAAASAAGARAVSAAGKTGMEEFAALLSLCDVVLCNDSGGMHLAAAVGAGVVAVFGLTDWTRTGPLGARAVAVHRPEVEGRRAIARESAEAAAVLASIPPEWIVDEAMRIGVRRPASD